MHVLLDKLQQLDLLSSDQRTVVEVEHRLTQVDVETVLLESGFVAADTLQELTDGARSIALDVSEFVPDVAAVACLHEHIARRYGVLPLALDEPGGQLLLAVASAHDVLLRDRLRRVLPAQLHIEYRRARASDIAAALDRCYGVSLVLDDILDEFDRQPVAEDATDSRHQLPVVRLVDAILHDAVTRRASDIHLSPEEQYVRIRYRIDGVLLPVRCLHRRVWSAMVVRIKVLCAMDIAETRLPQDGHVSRRIHGERIDFRVSSFPLRTGENIVLRVLDRNRGIRSLAELRLPDSQHADLLRIIQQPQGMLVVCGPTGSGKTTTLYALLHEREDDTLNVMTLEDPIEYPMLRVRQASVDAAGKLDFASGVRGLLRQDPDVLLIGEIRDSDSCAMAFRAAMSGHQVLTTVHAATTISALQRLLEFGADRTLMAASLSAVVSQRLLRRCCTQCQGEQSSCRHCHGSGYYGRIAILEILRITPDFSRLLLSGASSEVLLQRARDDGLQLLQEVAAERVAMGQIDSKEVTRVLGETVGQQAAHQEAAAWWQAR